MAIDDTSVESENRTLDIDVIARPVLVLDLDEPVPTRGEQTPTTRTVKDRLLRACVAAQSLY
jgi:hypothetical protein